MAPEKPSSKGQAWFCNTGLPASDVIIEVDDMTFHLHKIPLTSRSGKLQELISVQQKMHQTPKAETATGQIADKDIEDERQQGDDEEAEDKKYHNEEENCLTITLTNFPGGSETFETAAKFCYSVKIDISPVNAAPLLCAAEYLQMTEDFSRDNLIARTERFLSQSVFKNIYSSIKTLCSCQKVLPVAEELGLVWRCIDAIVSMVPDSDPALFGWPVNEYTANVGRRKVSARGRGDGNYSWLDELGNLDLTIFKRLILAMKAANLSAEIFESCLLHYAMKNIHGISRSPRKYSASSSSSSCSNVSSTEWSQRELLETIVSNLSNEKNSHATTRFLFGLLKTSYILSASEGCRSTLEKKIGSQLEQATLDDLLIPSYSYLNETLYDVDCIERILGYFLDGIEGEDHGSIVEAEADEEDGRVSSAALMLVGKLIDGYLSEIASDANLKPEKFYDLTISLPDRARLFDDGLYRAVDVYLKAHPWISEADRERICGALDWQKLTLEACTHAAQNERLPVRAVVQVLFFEQLQLRQAIAGTLTSADAGGEQGGGSNGATAREGNATWRAAVRENQVLRSDMNTMRTRVHELERECTTMKKAIGKMDRGHVEGAGWRERFGCKFKTQVCDSHESTTTVRGTRKARTQRHATSVTNRIVN